MKKNCCRPQGFTLIELLTVMAIIAILAAIAYPSYIDHVRKVRRADAQKDLLALANHMERHFSANDTYLDENGDIISLPFDRSPRSGSYIYYALSLSEEYTSQFTYKLVATAKDAQQADICGDLLINQAGTKKAVRDGVAKADCWR